MIAKITNKVFRVKKDFKLPNGIEVKRPQEIEVVMDVVYMNGFPIPTELQVTFLKFIIENPGYFVDDTRNF
jgi:hypothetical protein